VFFVAVGMQIDPRLLAQHFGAVIALTAVVIGGKILGVTVGAFLAGRDVRTSIQAGMSLAQIGEFSFIIAGVGTSLGATRQFLYPIAVAVSAITTLATPWLIRASGSAAVYIDRRMPPALQTYASLYGSWVQNLRASTKEGRKRSRVRRTVGFLLADVSIIAFIIISIASATPEVTALLKTRLGMSAQAARLAMLAGGIVAVLPFVYGAVRLARALGAALAAEAIPMREGVDLAAAPRRGLVVGLQLAILALVGIPFLAAIQPFVPLGPTAIVLGVGLALLAIPFWRTATNLEAHVRAGSQVITELLAAEARSADHGAHALQEARHLIPGLGEPQIVELQDGAPAIGQTLKSLNLRGLTGATVVALQPAGGAPAMPTGDEALAKGDIIVLAGSDDAIRAARVALTGGASNGH
jgi:CPA2 family monovalent cation:H+ antiporter-2